MATSFSTWVHYDFTGEIDLRLSLCLSMIFIAKHYLVVESRIFLTFENVPWPSWFMTTYWLIYFFPFLFCDTHELVDIVYSRLTYEI